MKRHEKEHWRLRAPHALLPVPLRAVLTTEGETRILEERIVEARERLRVFHKSRPDCHPLDDECASVTS